MFKCLVLMYRQVSKVIDKRPHRSLVRPHSGECHYITRATVCLLSDYNVHAVRLAVSSSAKIFRVGKNSPTVFSHFWTKVHQIWGHVWESL